MGQNRSTASQESSTDADDTGQAHRGGQEPTEPFAPLMHAYKAVKRPQSQHFLQGDRGADFHRFARARAPGTPRATLSRRFAALTGQSPMAYLTTWRMAVAARMLRDSDSTLRQIAQEVGYDSEFAFARTFKRTTGQAPGQYRKHAQATR
jgi:AraC-like DNA-binding protein